METHRVPTSDPPAFRKLRLRALREHPEAFTDGLCSFGVEPAAIRVGGRRFGKQHIDLGLTPS